MERPNYNLIGSDNEDAIYNVEPSISSATYLKGFIIANIVCCIVLYVIYLVL
jgi:hypothetical protein